MEKGYILAFCPSAADLWPPGWSQQFLLDWDHIAVEVTIGFLSFPPAPTLGSFYKT